MAALLLSVEKVFVWPAEGHVSLELLPEVPGPGAAVGALVVVQVLVYVSKGVVQASSVPKSVFQRWSMSEVLWRSDVQLWTLCYVIFDKISIFKNFVVVTSSERCGLEEIMPVSVFVIVA